jgi:hypothetical protein
MLVGQRKLETHLDQETSLPLGRAAVGGQGKDKGNLTLATKQRAER